ncbi:phosphoribosylformylglycinamidine synthase [Weissella uvarum]|uniref:phosphoribosylformylglycinamidine synthase subunit PurL n=1 Tax=Weissella uvarum TaxID=1479233 RepID=UPI00195FE2E3|nr:phosphoribosylformylglycinamidine synthase subunit PurL [Weissella uvarum]MBM7617495.1 phosphoribosylformylglycinamidine synthase [Weissella uvarum]MCM0595621.1 phosphoribosylformylglycinamidine synthase subunit PurL [Weissella uvarum]
MSTTQVQEPTPNEIKDTKLYQAWGLTDAEYELIEQKLQRLPNYTETGLFSAMWSEHCSYKKSKPVLKTFWSKNDRVLQGPGEGAGILDIGDNQAVVFKAESHNHPSAVEPYEGAATGVGGILRDIFSMGAQPIAVLDSLQFGNPDQAETKRLIDGVVAGIAGYGNAIGIPTVGGATNFDATYQQNPLVNVMAVGLLNQADLHVGQARGIGNAVIYVGATTGRDGIHGATFASSEFDSHQDQNRSAVQVGDPFMEKLVMDTTLNAVREFGAHIVGIQDMGAAGLVSSTAEMADKAGRGMQLNLDRVPQREAHMTPYELMLSESQERMILVVEPEYAQSIMDLFKAQDLNAVQIGTVTDGKQYQLYFQDELVADVPVDFLTSAPKMHMAQTKPARLEKVASDYQPDLAQPSETLLALLAQPNVASKASLYRHFDCSVKANTVVKPGQADAAIVRIRQTDKALAMTTDINSRLTYLDPFIGGQRALLEAAQNIVATGATPIGITDCLNFGNPDDPEIYYELAQSVAGINDMAQLLNTPVISGNVSLYNETDGVAIHPTPMVGMVGLISNTDLIVTQNFKAVDDEIYLINPQPAEFNGSELQNMVQGQLSGALKPIDHKQVQAIMEKVQTATKRHLVQSVHDLSEGGLAVALSESLMETPFGAQVELKTPLNDIFSEVPAQFIVSVSSAQQQAFEDLMGTAAMKIGKITPVPELHIIGNDAKEIQLPMTQVKEKYKDSLWQRLQ